MLFHHFRERERLGEKKKAYSDMICTFLNVSPRLAAPPLVARCCNRASSDESPIFVFLFIYFSIKVIKYTYERSIGQSVRKVEYKYN